MNQGGLKHAATDSRLDNKRERRRGASGRAAVLRRAPSDSDCSGETASLSADSGDRAIRPPPPPIRATKSRSRRRGSEWEVLEGLKDGQRFEKRPDVFNGYLHKKRKWPLKGWHKRFFVVDGGILVYARSPTDVARGRLHGSVDVGLSVISAKARRRRIDIDADEFIYHLRAKTPDVFRTWLNVLKAHRLYRQHLLTFGARESVPKIHAPLEELPPTETSSHTSCISIETSALPSSDDFHKTVETTTSSSQKPNHRIEYLPPENRIKNPFNWHFQNRQKKIVLFNCQKNSNAIDKIHDALWYTNQSLCSMNCFTRINLDVRRCNVSHGGSTNAEQQIHITDLESSSLNQTEISSPIKLTRKKDTKEKPDIFRGIKTEPAGAYYFFSRKKRNTPSKPVKSPMKQSKKSTNLVKYKNILDEPKLKKPLSKCMLLKRHRSKSLKRETKLSHRGVDCEVIKTENDHVQAVVENKEHKSLQDTMTASEYDKITENLLLTLFKNHTITHNSSNNEVKYYINQVIKDLYDAKYSRTDIHPVKMLFRSLLEYWLKNTTGEQFKGAVSRGKSVHRPSNRHFTQDKILSSLLISNATKETQFHGISDFIGGYEDTKHKPYTYNPNLYELKPKTTAIRCHSPIRDTESFEKERRIQELERVLKNTVYVCDTLRCNKSKEKDITITKKLLDNLDKLSKKSGVNNVTGDTGLETDDSSSELPKIQETINHLISETAIPPDVAKEFLNAYLGILRNDSSKSMSHSNSQSSEHLNLEPGSPVCHVQADPVQKTASKNISTASYTKIPVQRSRTNRGQTPKQQKTVPDSGEQYLKNVLDKITTIFSKANKLEGKKMTDSDKSTGDNEDVPKKLGRHVKEYPNKNLIHENHDENSVVIDLSKYDLEHISMFSDPALKGMMSINIKLKEKPLNFGESKRQQLSLKFCNESSQSNQMQSDDWLRSLDSQSLKRFFEQIEVNFKNNRCDNTPNDTIDLKPYTSSNDITQKAYCQVVHESEHSIDLSFNSSKFFKKEYVEETEDTYCFIVSSVKKNAVNAKLQPNKNEIPVEHNGITVGPQIHPMSQPGSSCYPDEYSIFEQPTPKVIDEKFILLLLENLTLLSKSIPSLYKDINTLYLKLKKKHEKVVRNCGNIQGLSLLGKIYNDDFKSNDRGTQYEQVECEDDAKGTQDMGITESTSTRLIKLNTVSDKRLSTYGLKPQSKAAEIQTEIIVAVVDSKSSTSIEEILSKKAKQAHSTKRLPSALTTEQAISCPNWYEQVSTKDCAVSTMIKTILDHTERARNRNIRVLNIRRDQPFTKVARDKELISVGKEFLKGMLISSPFKVSTESQTDRVFLHKSKDLNAANEFNACNEFDVYQLLLSAGEPQRSNSMIDSLSVSTRERSEDLKTIYRCKSEPSCCSGLVSPTSPPLRGPQAGFVSGTPGGRLASWIIESGGPLENASRELGQAQLSVQQLQRLLEALELQQQVHHDTDMQLIAKVEVDVL